MSGQVYSMDDEGENSNEAEIDNFAESLGDDPKENP